MKKAQITVSKLPVALILVSLVIIVFFVVPNIQDVNNGGNVTSFWSNYEYSPSDTTLSSYDMSRNFTNIAAQLECDVLGTQNNSRNCERTSSSGGDFINLMVKGGYGALVTLFNSVGVIGIIWTNLASILNIPPIIVTVMKGIIVFLAIISMIYLIFNRSDA